MDEYKETDPASIASRPRVKDDNAVLEFLNEYFDQWVTFAKDRNVPPEHLIVFISRAILM